jgi:peptidyl-prolyl cis-trans isomerase SurA
VISFQSLRQSRLLAAAAIVAGFVLAACSASNTARETTAAVALAPEEPATPASATNQAISNKTIPILVNDVPITQFDINQRVRLMRLGGEKGGTREAANQLIDETLQDLEAQRQGIRAPDSAVEGAFASIAQRLKMGPDQLTAALRSEGIDAESLRKRLRGQMVWQRLVQTRTQTEAAVSSQAVTAALVQKGDPSQMTVTEYMLQLIVFVVPEGSSASLYTQRRREAEAFRQRYQGCDGALEQAKALRGVVVKDLGRRNSGELSGPEGEEIEKTPAGRTGPPSQTSDGIELIAVCSTKDIQSTSIARTEIENELYLEQSASLGAELLKELRDRAIIEYR